MTAQWRVGTCSICHLAGEDMSDEKFPLPDEVAALVPETRYRVSFHDCCVNGEFSGVFERVEWTPNAKGDPPNYPWELVFDTGRIDVHGSWDIEELS